MAEHQVRLVERLGLCDDISLFAFERPEGYTFEAGQYLMLRLDPSEGPAAKPFSHCSCPDDERLEIATRMSGSPFKRALDALAPGDAALIRGPAGSFLLPDPQPPLAFLVGGVGITPIRSMLRQAYLHGGGMDAVFVFGNRGPSCVPFREEVESFSSRGLRVVHVFEHAEEDWTGDTGFITAEVVSRRVDDLDSRLFVTAGPPVMVEAMERVLDELGVGQDRRLIERFGWS